jgi:hypothetical protein
MFNTENQSAACTDIFTDQFGYLSFIYFYLSFIYFRQGFDGAYSRLTISVIFVEKLHKQNCTLDNKMFTCINNFQVFIQIAQI